MGIHALTLRYLRPEREAFADYDDSELARYCFKSKTTNQPAPPTETELALQEQQLKLAEFQLTELERQSELQQEFAGQIEPLLEQQAADAAFAREQAERLEREDGRRVSLGLADTNDRGHAGLGLAKAA